MTENNPKYANCMLKQLKELLKDITPINENTRKYPDEETAVIDYRRNPLNPSLFSYCFKNILGFIVPLDDGYSFDFEQDKSQNIRNGLPQSGSTSLKHADISAEWKESTGKVWEK